MLKKAILLPTYTLAVAIGGYASTSIANESYQNLTLEQAIQIAIQNNQEKKVSEQKKRFSESQYQVARAARWPTLDFQAGHQYSNNPTTLVIPELNVPLGSLGAILQGALAPLPVPTSISVPENKIKLTGNTTNKASLNLQYPLYTGGKISSIIKQATVGKEIADQEVKRTALQVIYDVKHYYYTVQLAQEVYQVANKTYEMFKYNAKLAEASYKEGVENVSKLDFYKLQNAVNLADHMRADFDAKQQAAKAALVYTMGLDWGTEITVSQPLSVNDAHDLNIDVLMDEAKQFNPDINKLKLAMKAMDAKVDEARSEYLPQVGLFASRHYQDLNVDGGLNTSENRNNWSAGIGVSMSLFNGGATKNRIDSAKLQKIQLKEQQGLAESGIALLLENKLSDLNKALTQVDIGEKATKEAVDNMNLVSRAFSIGAAETKELIEAAYQNALIQSNLLKAKHSALVSLAEIENTVGKATDGY